jgi:TorA maturation chaperone TorD
MISGKKETVKRLLVLSQAYQFLSSSLFEPNEQHLELLNDQEYMDEVGSCLVETGANKLSESFDHVKKGLQHSTLDTLLDEYRNIFGSTTVATDCPPYEMYFSGSHIFQQTQDLADISGFYRAFGLEVLKDDTANRWDHVAVELEFLHFLTYKQAYAIENHGDEEQESCLTAKKKFLNAHIGRWIKAFSRAVESKSPSGFYRKAAKLASDFVHFDMQTLGVSADEIQELQDGEPDFLQRLEDKSAAACGSCMDGE